MKTSILISAVIAALGIAASASAATRSESAAFAAQSQALSSVPLLARHGADDPVGSEDAGCDDKGTDLCAMRLAKHGADDGVDGADDNGVDLILAKHGADDLVDGEDDHGIDFILG
jgi:hypothetical protein